jgi:hypothetical protein
VGSVKGCFRRSVNGAFIADAKHRASFPASGLAASSKKSRASGDKRTSNIGTDLAPVDPLAGSNGRSCGLQAICDRGPIEKIHVIRQRFKSLGRQTIDGFLDLPAQVNRSHAEMISAGEGEWGWRRPGCVRGVNLRWLGGSVSSIASAAAWFAGLFDRLGNMGCGVGCLVGCGRPRRLGCG